MQTLNQLYTRKRVELSQRKFTQDRLKMLHEHVAMINATLLTEKVSKKQIELAVKIINKLDDIAEKADIAPLSHAINSYKNQISRSMSRSGGFMQYVQSFIDSAREKSGLSQLKKDPIVNAMQFADSMIDGFSKLNDVLSMHISSKKPEQQKRGEERGLGEAEDDYEGSLDAPRKDTTLASLLKQASPKYAKNMQGIIRNLFDTDKYDYLNEKAFIKSILRSDIDKLREISDQFARLSGVVNQTVEAIKTEVATEQPKTAEPQKTEVGTEEKRSEEEKKQTGETRELSDEQKKVISNSLNLLNRVASSMDMKFPDGFDEKYYEMVVSSMVPTLKK